MFDISWIELSFVAVLALLIIDPKDMPKMFHMAGTAITKARRLYRDILGGVHQLEKEIDLAHTDPQKPEPWRQLLPKHLRNLPDDFIPGSMDAEQHKQRRSAYQDVLSQRNSVPETNKATSTTHKADDN